MFGDEQHLQRDRRSNPTHRDRHGTWILRSTSDPGEHRRELRKGPSDRWLLRTGPIRDRYVNTDACNLVNRSYLGRGGVTPGRLTRSKARGVLARARGVPERAHISNW